MDPKNPDPKVRTAHWLVPRGGEIREGTKNP
jgi:hypothetical protein